MLKVAIYGQNYTLNSNEFILTLLNELQANSIDIHIEINFYNFIRKNNPTIKQYNVFKGYDDLDSSFDFFLSVGGDGTFLDCITYVRDKNIPILGINIGRLGFLANVKKTEIKRAIKSILDKDFSIIERTLLQVHTEPEIKELSDINIALNEVTVVRKNTTAMITLETFLNEEFLAKYWADGLIFSTPTGSTGYSLSCGGPVITPSAKNLVITPIAPHNLNVRPLIISDDTKIKLHLIGREKEALVSLDSRITTIPKNTTIKIKKADFTIKTVLLNNVTFLKTLRDKLLWGEDVRNV
jgi:NAD+ kinase